MDSLPSPPESTQTEPAIPKHHLRYGRPKIRVATVTPDPSLYWPQSERSSLGAPAISVQEPVPFGLNDIAPEGVYWPTAPTYRLIRDKRYRRGWVYRANCNTNNKIMEGDLLTCIESHPHVHPVAYENNCFIKKPIPGYVEAVAGVPYTVMLDNDPDQTLTVASVFTVESLHQYGKDGAQVESCLRQLQPIVWGTPTQGDRQGTSALYELGLKRNNRSGTPADANSHEGSYSLGTTVLEGNGHGIVLPAKQKQSDAALSRIKDVLKLLHIIGNLIMTMTCSREEVEVLEFQSKDDNVFGLGGCGCGATSCQCNVSCGENGGLLSKDMGEIQRMWHCDPLDAIIRMTIFVLLFRLPPGKFSRGSVNTFISLCAM